MEQIFMIEVFVKRIILKVEPYVKDEYELREEEEARKREEARLAALEALKKPKKGKAKKPPKPKKGKKGKGKGKVPAGPSEEESKWLQTCTMQMNCAPLFDFYVGHDNFVAPPPPPPPPKKGKKKKPKPKKNKKKKKAKPIPFKIVLPSEPLPQPPYFGVGNCVVFISRPFKLEEELRKSKIRISVWNRDETLNCIGFCVMEWHESYFDCIKKAGELNPVNMDKGLFRDTTQTEMVSNTVEYISPLQCEEDLKPSGEVEFYIRLTCLGDKILSHFVQLPEMERLPGRKYINDEYRFKDLEVVRHWEGTEIDMVPPVAYFFGAPDIMREYIKFEEKTKVYEDYVAPFTQSELAILAMGFPKGPCGGTNCPKRMEFRGSQHQFIHGEYVKGKYQHGQFVNKRDVHGPCGRLDCPLAKKVRAYLCNEGAYKTCRKPCPKDYY